MYKDYFTRNLKRSVAAIWLLQSLSCTAPEPAPLQTPKISGTVPVEPPSSASASPPPPESSALPSSKEIPGMGFVPGGTFKMGHINSAIADDEGPVHSVTVMDFYLDLTEVTNAAWRECMAAGRCRAPKSINTEKSGFLPEAAFRTDDRPVTAVSQQDAADYCVWKGLRLPTEAEFERAARGDDNRMYAWGNEKPSPERAVYQQKVTAPVGSKPDGKGPFGHLDLAGNVWEWTADHYDPMAYSRATAGKGIPADCGTILATQDTLRAEGKEGFTGTNPIPFECEHSLRGGAFNYFPEGLRASNRVHHPGFWRMIMAGFRCAKSAR